MKNRLTSSIKKIIMPVINTDRWPGRIMAAAGEIRKKILYFIYRLACGIDNRLVVFIAFEGRHFSDSPKALYLEMQRDDRFRGFRYIWCFINPEEKKEFFADRSNTTLIKTGSGDFYRAFAGARYWISNSVLPFELQKKKRQVFIQTWHGTPLKRLRYDILLDSNPFADMNDIRKNNDRDVRRVDYLLSPSGFASEKFASAFNLENLGLSSIIVEEGYPRNDYFYYTIFTE